MSAVFVPSSPLEALVREGDYRGTLELLRPLTPDARRSYRASVSRMNKLIWESRWKDGGDKGPIWGYRVTPEQERAAAAAALLCGSAQDAAEAQLHANDVIELSRAYELPCLPGLAEALMERAPHRIVLVQELIAAGVVQRPNTEAYTIGLIALPRFLRREKSLADCFVADPGLKDAVLRLFEVQGTAEDCLASADKYNSAKNSWMAQLLTLCREGDLARSTAIDKTLGVLEQDWPQYRAGWFSRFHKALDPQVEEMQAHASRYLHLCQSRIPPTVSLALEALGQLESASCIAPADLLTGLKPVFATESKGQVEIALKLMQRCLKRAPALGPDAAVIACSALVQDTPALQAKLLKQIAPFSRDQQVQAELLRHADGLAPSNRGVLSSLVGDGERGHHAAGTPVSDAQAVESVAVDAAIRRMGLVHDLDELVQLIAHVFENDEDIDAFERAMCGLVRASPLAAEDRPRFGPVLKRVAKLRKPVALELGRLVEFVCTGARPPPVTVLKDHSGPSRIHKLLQARVHDLMDLAAQGKRHPPLSTPTHQRGVIVVSELVARLRSHLSLDITSSIQEQALAILRLAPSGDDEDLAALRQMPDEPIVRALRHALGDDVLIGPERALYCAAARVRSPRSDDIATLLKYGDLGPDGPQAARYSWDVSAWQSGGDEKYTFYSLRVMPEVERHGETGVLAVQRHGCPPGKDAWSIASRSSVAGPDPGVIHYSSTLLPSDLEAFFAEGAREIGNNLNWDEARWQNKAYLQPLLDPTVQPGRMALLLLACSLAGKEPGQTAMAVDGLVQLHRRSKLDVALLGETLGRLIACSLVKVARLRKSLDAALLIEPGLAGSVIEWLVASLLASAGELPKDHAKLLELLHELLVSTGRRLDSDTKTKFGGFKVGGTAKAMLNKLLTLESGR